MVYPNNAITFLRKHWQKHVMKLVSEQARIINHNCSFCKSCTLNPCPILHKKYILKKNVSINQYRWVYGTEL